MTSNTNISKLDWPLMANNITREDLDLLIDFLKQDDPILTQSKNVKAFEAEWSEWVGMKYSVFVNSGSSANLLSMAALKAIAGEGEVIVSPFGWVSDIASVIQCGFQPVFADINPRTLGMDDEALIAKLNDNTKGVLYVHAQGFNGLSDRLLEELERRKIPLIEDVCESHGATFKGRKCGSFGLMSNFSFYYAHHMSTIEGGMICTDDEEVYQIVRMYRSHGMVRELTDEALKEKYKTDNPELNPQFIFAYPAYNVRSTEINAVIGRNQLKRLDANNEKRRKNFKLFLDLLDSKKYRTDYELEGSCNYAFNLILNEPDFDFCDRVMAALDEAKVEYRRGSAGGGNQLRQPYLKDYVAPDAYKELPELDHVHFFGFYIGNYPDLPEEKIHKLCEILNAVE